MDPREPTQADAVDDARADSFAELDDSVASLLGRLGRAPAVAVGGADGALVPLTPGTLVGDSFEIVERLGAGGMAVVYLARDRRLGRAVAIKLYRWPPAPGRLSRTMREALAMARLSDTQVLTLYEVGEFSGRMYIAMEFVDGWNARDWLHREKPSARAVLQLYLRAGEGLAAAHAVGIVHCDFKPDNVLVGRDGRVRVADFGLARALAGAADAATTSHEHGGGEALATLSAEQTAVAGTPAYMAPEQQRGAVVDARADQYAFCVALHEALCGRRPDPPDGRTDMSKQPAANAALPAWIDRALRRGREPDPARRFASMAALLAALRDDPRARRLRWSLAAGLAAVLAGTVAALAGEPPPLCLDTGAPLAGVWDDARRVEVAAAFTRACADEHACPAEPYARTRVQLDRYADAWAAARTAACEATHRHGVQSAELLDRRMLCLDERLRGLDALVDVLAAADAKVAREAPRAAGSLASLATCADAAHLMAQLAPPDDPAVVPRVEAQRARLQQAEAMRVAGRPAEALALTRDIDVEAREIDYPPLRAEVDEVLGELLLSRDPAASEAHLHAAFHTATAHGHALVSSEAASSLVWNVGYVQSRFEAAEVWALQALAETERRGTDARLRARVLSTVASLRSEQGRHTESLALQDQALALLDEAALPAVVSDIRANRAATLDMLGRTAEARAEYEAVIAAERGLYGPRHPKLATSYSNLGLLRMRDAPDEAVALHRVSLEILDETYGADDEARWQSLLNYSIALVAAGQAAQAIAPVDEALAITRRVLGPDHAHVGLCLSARASALRYAGRLDEAVDAAQAALELTERSYPADHDEVVVQRSLLAQVLAAAGRDEQALPWFERAVAGWERRGDTLHPRLAEALVEQGEALQRLGRSEAARAAFTRALQIAAQAEVDPPMVARARAGLR